jgi:hypothetical protein
VGDVPDDERPGQEADEDTWQDANADPWHGGEFENSIQTALAQGVDLKEITRVARTRRSQSPWPSPMAA